MKWRRAIGYTWAAIGLSLALVAGYDLATLAQDPQHGWQSAFFEPSWWSFQIGMVVFIFGCAFIGIGVALGKRWGDVGLRVCGPIALLYLVAYDLLGGERAWWLALLALLLTVFVGVSVYFVYQARRGNAA